MQLLQGALPVCTGNAAILPSFRHVAYVLSVSLACAGEQLAAGRLAQQRAQGVAGRCGRARLVRRPPQLRAQPLYKGDLACHWPPNIILPATNCLQSYLELMPGKRGNASWPDKSLRSPHWCACTAQDAECSVSEGTVTHLRGVHALSGSRDGGAGAGPSAGGGSFAAGLVRARPQDRSEQPAGLLLREPVRPLQQPAGSQGPIT